MSKITPRSPDSKFPGSKSLGPMSPLLNYKSKRLMTKISKSKVPRSKVPRSEVPKAELQRQATSDQGPSVHGPQIQTKLIKPASSASREGKHKADSHKKPMLYDVRSAH